MIDRGRVDRYNAAEREEDGNSEWGNGISLIFSLSWGNAGRMTTNEDVTQWIAKLHEGDEEAVAVIWQQYFDKLVKYARRKLDGDPRRHSDEEDVALSAMHSFCRGVQKGRFHQLEDRDDLWKLLVTITARKAYAQMRYNRAEKRGGGDVRGESVFAGDQEEGNTGIEQMMGSEPTPEFANMVAEQCEKMLSCLTDENQRKVAIYKLQGYSNDEIAEQLGCVTRTVERKLERIRSIWIKEKLA